MNQSLAKHRPRIKLDLANSKYNNLSSNKKVRSICYAKLVLSGEHGVVHGAKAVGMPIEVKSMTMDIELVTKIQSKLNHKSNYDMDSGHQVILNDTDHTKDLLPTLLKALDLLNISSNQKLMPESCRLNIVIKTQIPLAAGLGASAALSINFIKALSRLFNIDITCSTINHLANILEQRFHGKPSGLDVNIISHSCLISFVKGQDPIIISPPKCFNLALIDSKIYSSTKILVKSSTNIITKNLKYKQRIISLFNQAHDLIIDGCLTKNSLHVIKSFELSRTLFTELKLTNYHLNTIMNKIIDLGALAVKPTGSGAGGFVLALLPHNDSSVAKNIIDVFNKDNVFKVLL